MLTGRDIQVVSVERHKRKGRDLGNHAAKRVLTVGSHPDYSRIKRVLRYDRISGTLIWKRRPMSMFKDGAAFDDWNRQHAGTVAFTSVDPNGYLYGGLLGKMYRAHRIIWLLCHRDWPHHMVVHLNGDRSDNRVSNLRDLTRSERLALKSTSSENRSISA